MIFSIEIWPIDLIISIFIGSYRVPVSFSERFIALLKKDARFVDERGAWK